MLAAPTPSSKVNDLFGSFFVKNKNNSSKTRYKLFPGTTTDFLPEWTQSYCGNNSNYWTCKLWLTGCSLVSYSKEEASAIETELLRDYKFGQQQLIEIWGQACAVAITKVCVFPCSVCLCSLCLFFLLPRRSSPPLWSDCSLPCFKSVTDNIAHSALFTTFRKRCFDCEMGLKYCLDELFCFPRSFLAWLKRWLGSHHLLWCAVCVRSVFPPGSLNTSYCKN